MRILIVGGGGREHAIAWALSRSPRRPELIIAPGNTGTAHYGVNIDVRADDVDSLVRLAIDRKVDMVVVGPEVPLVLGLADRLSNVRIPVLGPSAAAARLEGSKAFAKAFMDRHGIPTAAYRTFQKNEFAEASAFVLKEGAPIVVKASGLAAGKGAIVCETEQEALDALSSMMENDVFGEAGEYVVVESFMRGEEASIFAICDGTSYVLLAAAQDHKRVGEDDTGPNTGGMGAYAPAPLIDARAMAAIEEAVIKPTISGMAAEGAPYSGVLYCGIMMTADGPRVVEYNCRFGDPEAQVILPLLEVDLLELFEAATSKSLSTFKVAPARGACACVVLASEGYPGPYPRGKHIRGVEKAGAMAGVEVFHAGTRRGAGGLETAGGRVLTVSVKSVNLPEAVRTAYQAISHIDFDGMQFRRDIGRKGLRRLGFSN